jgi:glycosyltransferase involved in cell wall biosynthesis
VTIHDLIFLRYPDYYPMIDRYIYIRKFKDACERADIILATSEQTKRDIIHFFETDPSKIEVTYQNCNEGFALQVNDSTKSALIKTYQLPSSYILNVGTIEQRKDQLTVLKAYHKLNDKGTKLVFVGRQTAYAKELHAYIHENNLQDDVLFLQDVKQEDLPGIYQLSSIFVYASEFEGFGIPILEGLRSHVPVVTAKTSSLPEVGDNAASYFAFGDSVELSGILGVLLHDVERRQEMISKGVIQAKKFDTTVLSEQLMKIYQG